jgi:hypothetical protein
VRRFAFLLGLCACTPAKPVAPLSPVVAPPAAAVPDNVVIAPAEAVSRCVSGPAGRTELMPSEATVVGALDVAALWSFPLVRDNRLLLDQGGATMLVESARQCGIGLEHWRRVTFGMNPLTSDFAMVLAAEGIGLPQSVACIGEELARKQGKRPWTRVEGSEPARYDLVDGAAGWVLDECTVVIASTKWIAPVERLVAGTGTSVLGGPLEPPMRRAVVAQHLWFAASLPPSTLPGTFLADAQDFSANVDLSLGLVLATSLGFPSATIASAKAVEIRTTFDSSRGMFSTLGVPQSVLDRVEINARGSTVAVDARVSTEELATIATTLRKK